MGSTFVHESRGRECGKSHVQVSTRILPVLKTLPEMYFPSAKMLASPSSEFSLFPAAKVPVERFKSCRIPIDAYQLRNRAMPCHQPADCCPFSITPVVNAFNRGRYSFNTVLSAVELAVSRQTPAPPSLPTPITVSYVVYPCLCTTSSSKKMDTSDPV